MYEATQEIMDRAGLPAYEISNHARPGFESRHNLTYWRGGDYIGIGPGAHGRLTNESETRGLHQISNPTSWIERVEQEGHATAKQIPLSSNQRAEELIMMGMRINEGIDIARFRKQCGLELSSLLDQPATQKLIDGGFLTLDDQHLNATASGRQRLNALLSQMLL